MPHKPLNADKSGQWKADIAESVDQFNKWFMRFAPETFRTTRSQTTEEVKGTLVATQDLCCMSAVALRSNPRLLRTLRMCTAPPLAVDRLIGLADANKSLVKRLEKGKLPAKMEGSILDAELVKLSSVVTQLLDRYLFPWVDDNRKPTGPERERACTIVADRLTNCLADPIIRNAQEQRQLSAIDRYLKKLGYRLKAHPTDEPLTQMEAGTYCFRLNLFTKTRRKVPVDVAIQPKRPRADSLPILIEAKSAGDYTNTNKRRKEEGKKMPQLKELYGPNVQYVLFLGGYFDGGYLGYALQDGFDWIWEHRIQDLMKLGL